MRRLTALALLVAACAPGQGVLDVTLDATPPVSGIDHFVVTVTADHGVANVLVQPSSKPATIPPPATFSLTFAASEAGPVTVRVEARDPVGALLAWGETPVTVSASESTSATITLRGGSGLATDMAAPDLSPSPDLAVPLSDLAESD